MNKVNELVLCIEDYKNESEFKYRLAEAIMLLTEAGYICTLREEEIGIFVINYERDNRSHGCPYPYWLTPEQWESISLENNLDSSE